MSDLKSVVAGALLLVFTGCTTIRHGLGEPCHRDADCRAGLVCVREHSDSESVCKLDLLGPRLALPQANPAPAPIAPAPTAPTPSAPAQPAEQAALAALPCTISEATIAARDVATYPTYPDPIASDHAVVYTARTGGQGFDATNEFRFQPLDDDGHATGAAAILRLDWVGHKAVLPIRNEYLVAGASADRAVLLWLDRHGVERRRIDLGEAVSLAGEAAIAVKDDDALVVWTIGLGGLHGAWVSLRAHAADPAFEISRGNAPKIAAVADGFHLAWSLLENRTTHLYQARIVPQTPGEAGIQDVTRAGGENGAAALGYLTRDNTAFPVVLSGALPHYSFFVDDGSPDILGTVSIIGFSGDFAQTSAMGALAYDATGVFLQPVAATGDRLGSEIRLDDASGRASRPSMFASRDRIWIAWQQDLGTNTPSSVAVRVARCATPPTHTHANATH